MRLLFLFIVLLSTPSFGQTSEYKKMLEQYYNDFPTISLSQANKKLGEKNVYFLDTREKAEYNVSHIKGARYVGYDNFKLSTISDIPKNAVIIVYCSIGARSQTIGEKLKKAGYTNVKNLYGGLFHWNNCGYSMVTGSNNTSTSRIHGFSKEWGKWIKKGTVVYE